MFDNIIYNTLIIYLIILCILYVLYIKSINNKLYFYFPLLKKNIVIYNEIFIILPIIIYTFLILNKK